MQLALVENQVNNCTNSHYSIFYDDSTSADYVSGVLPSAFTVSNVTEVRQMNITLQVPSVEVLSPGSYTIEVWEEDWYTGFTAKTVFIVEVREQSYTFPGVSIVNTEVVESQPETASNSTEEAAVEADPEEVTVVPELEFDCNGNLIYSWQRTQKIICSDEQDLSRF